MTDAQAGVFIAYCQNPRDLSFNLPFIVAVPGSIPLDKLQSSITSAAQLFAPLWGRFDATGGAFHCKPAAAGEVPVEEYPSVEAASTSLVRPFDLGFPPLVRAGVIRSESESALVLDFHHIAADGYSVGLFIRSLAELLKNGPVLSQDTSLAHYAAWASERYDTCRPPGLQAMSPDLTWPTRTTGESSHPKYSVHRTQIDGILANSIRARLRAERSSPFTFFYLCYLFTAAQVHESAAWTSTFVSSGRTGPHADAFGMFSRFVHLRFDPGAWSSFGAALRALSREVVHRIRYEEWLMFAPLNHPSRRVARPKSAFVYHGRAMLESELLDPAQPFWKAKRAVRTDVIVNVLELKAGFEVAWEFNPQMHDPIEIAGFSAKYLRTVARVAESDWELSICRDLLN